MLKSFYHNKSFNANQKIKKTSTNFILDKTLTPIKVISKHKDKINKGTNYTPNIIKSKSKKLFSKKNNLNNLKIKILNHSINNSRNLSSLNGFISNSIFTKQNYNSFQTNNSFSVTTNLKTTMDSNIPKTHNIKEKINNRKDSSSFIDNKSITFFSSSFNWGKKGNEKVNNKNKNISKIKKRPKIKIHKTYTNYFSNIKNINKNKFIKDKDKINNSFIASKRINILKNIHNNILTPIRQNTKKKYKNSISLNKKINKIEKNINLINREQKNINKNKISINKNTLKNIYILMEKKKESFCNTDEIKKENKNIEKIKNQLRIIKNNTFDINRETNVLNKELEKYKKEINSLKTNIVNIINDKKNVNTMIILLHKRIIDIKKRLKEHDEENYYLDKSIYEINLKYQDDNILNK